MPITARDLLTNLLETVRLYGFVPNGSRRYYDNRSQPPLLAAMMRLYEQRTGDSSFVRRHLSLLEKEYEYWMREQSIRLNSDGKAKTRHHVLNLYRARTDRPRPESYYEDVEQTANMTPAQQVEFYSNIASVAESGWDFSSRWMNFSAMADLLKDPSFAALKPNEQQNQLLQLLILTDLVPFDLNGILYQYERTLQMYFCRWSHEQIDFDSRCQWYGKQARRRYDAMHLFLYDQKAGIWSDYNVKQRQLNTDHLLPTSNCRNLDEPSIRLVNDSPKSSCSKAEQSERPIFVSDIGSLWYLNGFWRTEQVLESLSPESERQETKIDLEIQSINRRLVRQMIHNLTENSTSADQGLSPLQRMLLGSGGIAMSNVYSGQQWDYPNAWAPYEQYVISGLLDTIDSLVPETHEADEFEPPLLNSEVAQGRMLARKMTRNWLRATYCGWSVNNSLYEKYDVRRAGQAGSGGEYTVQEGFGWTNGVTMKLAEMYADHEMVIGDCPTL
jgi:alpha,alpha-trehalase